MDSENFGARMRHSVVKLNERCRPAVCCIVAGVAGLGLASARGAERPGEGSGYARPAVQVELDAVSLLATQPVASYESASIPDSGPTSAALGLECLTGEIVSHTDVSFEGGTYKLQAGFRSGEVAIATYSVPQEQFPIVVESMEAILGQFQATATVTEYSFIVWDGPPDLGLIRAVFSSDDIEIPHARLPPGTKGVNIVILIDPSDPEQLVLDNDSGTNSFSIGFRIDMHNQPSPFPCLLPADWTQNAFPITDVNPAVLNLTGNWLHAILCGNACDGLNTFDDLPTICRPTGNWVMRATYRCPNAPEPAGACCVSEQICIDGVQATSCEGLFMGSNTACALVECPEPRGACCFIGGGCLPSVTTDQCEGIQGVYAGDDTSCAVTSTCTPGACCRDDGSCVEVAEFQCDQIAGTFKGIFSSCATANCPQPPGSCCIGCACFPNILADDCEALFLGTWNGPDSTCVGVTCSPGGAIIQALPAGGTLDARQPHPPNDASLDARTGIGGPGEEITLVLDTPGARPNCFKVAESAPDPVLGANGIASVVEGPAQVWKFRLFRPITPGAVTSIVYADGQAGRVRRYTAHPANANAVGAADLADIAFLISVLNGNGSPLFGNYSLDIDHSGAFDTADVLRAMDLLNGAGQYAPWLDTPLP